VPHDATRPPAIVIALTRRHVGIALPARHGFEFVAVDPDFELLDGSSFRRLEQLEAAAQTMARAVTSEHRSEVISVQIARAATPAGQRSPARAARYATKSMSIKPVDKIGALG
jgi:hypothetical protein